MDAFKYIGDWWKGLGGAMRVFVVGGALSVAVALGAFYYLGPSEATVPVGADMPPEEVKAVRDRLTALGIPNTLDRRAVNVLVPESRRAEAVVGLAAEGLPSRTGKGLESFEESSFGATPFQNSVNYQRALQNELVRAIVQIDSVAAARVLIARPEPTPFLRDQRPPTASVVLRMKPNANLSKAAAGAIVSLVAHAVDGLKAENVTVIDSTGRLLSDPYAANKDDLPGELVDFRKALELYLAKKAQDTLIPTLGAGRVVVTVNADLNYQKVKERQKRYTPEEKVVIAERLTTSKTTSTPPRGPAGVVSNSAARPGGSSGGSAGGSQEETTSTDYAFGEIIREMDDRAGAITRLTVAAVVDLTPPTPADGSAAATQPLATPDDIQELIKTAIGFKTGRDEIKVANMRMVSPVPAIPEIDEETPRLARMQAYVSLARNISLAFAAVVGFAIIPLALLRRSRPAKPLEPAAPPPPTPEQLAAAARDRRRQQLEKLADLTRTKPEAVSEVFGILVSK
jgi:flagellar M-ring protein FliF